MDTVVQDVRGNRFIDLTGQRFGKLVVTGYVKIGKKFHWYCDCDCGNKNILINGDSLRRGIRTDCGKEKGRKLKMTYNRSERFCCECNHCIDLPNKEKFCTRMMHPRSQFTPAMKDGRRLCPFFDVDVDYYEFDEETGGFIVE